MSLPAILSITIVGVPYLILSLQYYRRKKPEEKYKKVNIPDQQNPARNIHQGLNQGDINEKNKQIDNRDEIPVGSYQSLGKSDANDQEKLNPQKKEIGDERQQTMNLSQNKIPTNQQNQGSANNQILETQNINNHTNQQDNKFQQNGETPQDIISIPPPKLSIPPPNSNEEQIVKDIGFEKYKRWQNIFLVISSIIFFQSIISRVYVKNTQKKIEVPEFFVLSAINALCVIFLYNCIYSGILALLDKIFDKKKSSQMIAKFFFVFYGLSMTFPIYAGLDDFIKLDFITSIIAIIYSVIIQYGVMKIKELKNWPTYIDFNSIK